MHASTSAGAQEEAAHSPLFWTLVLTLIATQVMALWLLCSHQMQKAQARQATAQIGQIAFDDCLQYLVNSTIGGCVTRLGLRTGGDTVAEAQPLAEAVPAAHYAGR